jgi:hypothetical protein
MVGLVLLLAGAIGQQPAPEPSNTGAGKLAQPTPPPVPLAQPKADPKAAAALAAAIAKLDPKRLKWVETILWQQATLQGLTFHADGTFLSGPDHRLRLDLKLQLGNTVGALQVVSDGKELWEGIQIGQGERFVTKKLEMKKVLENVSAPAAIEQAREEFYRLQALTGVRPLLQSIERNMVATQASKASWKGRPTIRLTAVWSPDVTKDFITPQNQHWPGFSPRSCRLYLDEATGWPYRVEWWGPAPPQADDVQLLQMEFRNPKLNEALSPEQQARAFQFEPGPRDTVSDGSKVAADWFKNWVAQTTPKTPGK